MTYKQLEVACGEPHANAAGAGRGSRPAGQRRGATVRLSVLAVGALGLLAACTPSTSSDPSATTPAPSATQTSSPAASPSGAGSSGNSSPGTGSPGSVTAGPASSSQLAAFTAAAQGQCGFTSSADTLTNPKVTNNGWGSATIVPQNSQAQGGASMLFRGSGASWSYDTCGSSFDNGSVPQDVLTALGL
jgi:hypothetical protein